MVDVGNEDEPPNRPMAINGEHRDSTGGGGSSAGDRRPPSNLSSSSRSTPSAKQKERENGAEGKPGTPSGPSKPTTPNGNAAPHANGKPPTPGIPGYPPGFGLRPPGAEGVPLGYPYQNGVPGGLPGAFPPRPPLVSILHCSSFGYVVFVVHCLTLAVFCCSLELIQDYQEFCHPTGCLMESLLLRQI